LWKDTYAAGPVSVPDRQHLAALGAAGQLARLSY
jgi:hypothetical protein